MYLYVLFCVFSVFAKQSVAIVNQDLMAIDLNDILSEKLMPMSVFHMTGSSNSDIMSMDKNRDYQLFHTNSPADFNSAFNLMQFHRKMIQNYKCNNYIAKQILTDIAPHTIQNRMGIAPNATNAIQVSNHHPMSNNNIDSALFDQGSSAYKNWLTKLALLDDVYKQIRADSSTMKHANDTPPFRRIDGTSMHADNDVEVGVASGYAIQHAIPSGFVPPQNHANDNDFEPHHRYAVAGNKAAAYSINTLLEPDESPPQSVFVPEPDYYFQPNFYPNLYPNFYSNAYLNTYPNYYAVTQPYITPHAIYHSSNDTVDDKKHKWWSFHNLKEKFKSLFKHKHKNNDSANLNQNQHQLQGYDSGYDYGMSYDSGASSKEMTLKKVYELALTAIAYLAFGIFVLHVIMCITTVKAQTGNSMMVMAEVPTEAVDMSMTMGEVRESQIRRKRSYLVDRFSEVNEMSRKVLQSIEAAVAATQDNGNCLKRILCENNKAETISNNRIWLPVWGLGMSWLSSHLTDGQVDSPMMFDCLKALIYGLGNGMCEEVYTCDSKIIANSRKLSRLKRSSNN